MSARDLDPADFTIHKISLALREHQTILCAGKVERWLSVQMQDEQLTAWYEVDLSRGGTTGTDFGIVGTGHPRPIFETPFLGTVQDGRFVWHVYQCGSRWTAGGDS